MQSLQKRLDRIVDIYYSLHNATQFQAFNRMKPEQPLTLMWNFRQGASPLRLLKSLQNLNSATFETMNTEKLDLKPQY
ncbi:hypothetical protein STEG23_034658 [Scotinomys teguina]